MRYLRTIDVLKLHEVQLRRYGGLAGVRDPSGLEAAVHQPQAGFGDELFYPTIESVAAAYMFFISQQHAFVDGNKRTALSTALAFLAANATSLTDVSEDELIELSVSVASGSMMLPELIKWFAEHAAPHKRRRRSSKRRSSRRTSRRK